jgi:lipopolysaccharide/colanic/teichoic acid biosynthesis glycosyltransferase
MSIIAAGDRRGTEAPPTREATVARFTGLALAPSGPYVAIKWAADFALALLLLLVTAPVVLTAMLVIKLTSRGPAVYTQTRLGKNGKPFMIYKLRTMVHQCENLSGARWCMPNDPRITPLGRVLRKLHIDELPQLWNVLKGEMSLIGPRPERPEFLPQLEQAILHYRARLLVKPGVTGLAQVQLPPDTNLASVRVKLAYDLFYVRHVNLWLDLRILFSTACKLVGLSFSATRTLAGFPTQDRIESDSALLCKGETGCAPLSSATMMSHSPPKD